MMDLAYSYSREAAIDDGELIDVSDIAFEAGFHESVALTASTWMRLVEVPSRLAAQTDERDRLWTLLKMLQFRLKKPSKPAETPASKYNRFQVVVQDIPDGPLYLEVLEAVFGLGDQGEPVITVRLPGEDWR